MNDFIFDFDGSIPEFDIVVQHVSTEGGGGGQTIEVDSELSTTSNNPVKNKVITTALNGKVSASSLATVATSGSYNDLTNKPTIPSSFPVDVELSDSSTNPVQNRVITEALGDKMDYPAGGMPGQVLQKTADGQRWADVGTPSQEQITQAVNAYIAQHPEALNPLSPAVKSALLQIAEKVAYIDEDGQDYYDALDAALNTKVLLSITAVYMQTGAVYDTDSLDSLKADLVVTAYYDDGTTANVTSLCTLSGTLTAGTSTITATYQEMTASFTVTVQHLYAFENGTHTFSNGHYITVTEGHIVYGELVSSSTISMVANASTISDNTTTANTQDNNTSTKKLFDVSAGSVISWEITPLQVYYSGAKQGQKYINMTLKSMNEGVSSNIAVMFNRVINTLSVGTPLTGSYTAESNTEVWLIGTYYEKSSSLVLRAQFDVKIFVDGVRYV